MKIAMQERLPGRGQQYNSVGNTRWERHQMACGNRYNPDLDCYKSVYRTLDRIHAAPSIVLVPTLAPYVLVVQREYSWRIDDRSDLRTAGGGNYRVGGEGWPELLLRFCRQKRRFVDMA